MSSLSKHSACRFCKQPQVYPGLLIALDSLCGKVWAANVFVCMCVYVLMVCVHICVRQQYWSLVKWRAAFLEVFIFQCILLRRSIICLLLSLLHELLNVAQASFATVAQDYIRFIFPLYRTSRSPTKHDHDSFGSCTIAVFYCWIYFLTHVKVFNLRFK